ncbi:MAG: hypothetical protein JXR95_07980 [Deltaproteobacteria bacterium]|nr:hypothetical protein [Deltaproteobacteria bacterium]
MKNLLILAVTVLFFISCDDSTEKLKNCGNGIIDIGEDCEINNTDGETCISMEFHNGTLGCTLNCRFDFSDCEEWGKCGDNERQVDYEECDENAMPFTNCAQLPGENFDSGLLSCLDDCTFDRSNCIRESCGNGIIDSTESCDGTQLNGMNCENFDFYGGILGCYGTSCEFNTLQCEGYCGDGELQPEYEECDDTHLNNMICDDFGFYSGEISCKTDCTIDTDGCSNYCGDGILHSLEGEECDLTVDESITCEGLGYNGGNVFCDSYCKVDISDCELHGICGDNIVQSSETCDGTNFNGVTCLDYGFFSGELYCPMDCSEINSNCCKSRIYVNVSAGDAHTCAVDIFGKVWCWGNNSYGQLGIGNTNNSSSPEAVDAASDLSFLVVSCGKEVTCALSDTGRVWCWGKGSFFDSTQDILVPREISGTYPDFTSVSCGANHCCGSDSTSEYCWGSNTMYEFGTGDSNPTLSATPLQTFSFSGSSQISSGDDHSCKLDTAGTIECWGSNSNSMCGLPGLSYVTSPEVIDATVLNTIVDITAGGVHSCFIDSTGQGWCFGANDYGQLGQGDVDYDAHLPEMINQTDLLFSSISAGRAYTCAVSTDGKVWCWGRNQMGQLGNHSNENSSVPVTLYPGSVSEKIFVNVTTGTEHACALENNGILWCWGKGTSGQLGNGSISTSSIPVTVSE